MSTVFKIYYTNPHTNQPGYKDVDTLPDALRWTEDYRKIGMTFVTMVSENTDHVGKPGVDAVVDGKTPDGEVYDWSKAGRAGKVKRSERTVSALQGTDAVVVPVDDEPDWIEP